LSRGKQGFFGFLWYVLSFKRNKIYAIASGLAFFIAYSFGIGIFFQSPNPLPEDFPTPSYDLILDGPIGQVPWLVVYLNRNFIFSINLEAAIVTVVLTTLFTLNIVVLAYSKQSNCGYPIRKKSLFSVIPSFFSVFSCCGGGLVMSLLFTLGAGGLWSSIFLPYGWVLANIAALVLALNLLLSYKRISSKVVVDG